MFDPYFFICHLLIVLLLFTASCYQNHYMQFERGEALEIITQDVRKALEEECDEESLKSLPKAVDTVRKKVKAVLVLLNFIRFMRLSFYRFSSQASIVFFI